MANAVTMAEQHVLDYKDPEFSIRVGKSGLLRAPYTAEELKLIQRLVEENLDEMASHLPEPTFSEKTFNSIIRYREKIEVFLMKALMKGILHKSEYIQFKKAIDRNIVGK